MLGLQMLACSPSFTHCPLHLQDVSTGGARCSCPQLSDRIMAPKEIKTIEILPPTSSCKNLEVIVHLKKGRKYCLNPNAKKMKEIFRQLKTRVLA
ncbi:C-X-C motif chemokine 10-like [Latimeria chalumnae]|uniref:C-X-C motif chemokine 10-like n=1 Tax=Latimeria chalumnae TaxID=7897 RepID=UPI0006D8F0F8|nr:PREDICTED: C-X-C motif chemokine 10-like isoform X1 [Latimeria chalumnae]|eukprot:XP_014343848.1 PREDICTED: C-X-C motif chemokine 10-like isoform X1 [Latimeria chalumnae]